MIHEAVPEVQDSVNSSHVITALLECPDDLAQQLLGLVVPLESEQDQGSIGENVIEKNRISGGERLRSLGEGIRDDRVVQMEVNDREDVEQASPCERALRQAETFLEVFPGHDVPSRSPDGVADVEVGDGETLAIIERLLRVGKTLGISPRSLRGIQGSQKARDRLCDFAPLEALETQPATDLVRGPPRNKVAKLFDLVQIDQLHQRPAVHRRQRGQLRERGHDVAPLEPREVVEGDRYGMGGGGPGNLTHAHPGKLTPVPEGPSEHLRGAGVLVLGRGYPGPILEPNLTSA